jgi:CubicO group peptidase (beta-lactamase class C family)
VQDRVLAPLEMTATSVSAPPGEIARGHARIGDETVMLPKTCGDLDVLLPASAMRSTVDDLLRWAQFQFHRGRVHKSVLVSGDRMHELHEPQIVTGVPRTMLPAPHFMGYGFGWMIGDHNGRKVLHGGGRVAGATSDVVVVPHEHVAIVVLTNLDMSWMGHSLAFEALDALLGDPRHDWSQKTLKRQAHEHAHAAAPAARPASLPAGQLRGVYRNTLYGDLRVEGDDELRLHYSTDVSGVLEHVTLDGYRLRSADNPLLEVRKVRIAFRPDEDGNVAGLELSTPVPHHHEVERVWFAYAGPST